MQGLPSRFWEYISRSTLKREAASVLMLWYLAIGTGLFFIVTLDQAIRMWEGLQLAVFGAFMAAFFGDFVAKQTTWGGPPMGQDGPSDVKVVVPPQKVDLDGIVQGEIKVDGEQKANG